MKGSVHKTYDIRCPVYGFVRIDDWEREIIQHPAFQRLRRIRQLAWTDYVYPGAMHTRFEHSLGVMHMASMLYDGVVSRSEGLLEGELGFDDQGLKRDRALVRLAALLHDVGHAPFSHGAERLFPLKARGADGESEDNNAGTENAKDSADEISPEKTERYTHEEYSSAIIRYQLADVINRHPYSQNRGITADLVAGLIDGDADLRRALFWRDLIAGQLDADRMDYLLRDSHHTGVGYGRYDWHRLVHTIEAVPGTGEGGPRLGVSEGGWNTAEGLILARYSMFMQVYFHKTRVAYDHHLEQALAEMLPEGHFPAPDASGLEEYLTWDDWRVLGLLSEGRGGEHRQRLMTRNHYRQIRRTAESPGSKDLEQLDEWRAALGDLLVLEKSADKSWYKVGQPDVPVVTEDAEQKVRPLSEYSHLVKGIGPTRQVLLYTRPEDREQAEAKLKG